MIKHFPITNSEPDFSSISVPAGQKVKWAGITAPTVVHPYTLDEVEYTDGIIVDYELVDQTTQEKNDDEIFSSKADAILATLDAGNAPSAQVQKAVAYLIRRERREEGSI
jgi:hypothetical protein